MLSLICVVGFTACSEEEEIIPTYPTPDWAYAVNPQHTASMTVVATLPEEIAVYASPEDKLAAFIDDECRGIAVCIGQDQTYYLMIKGEQSDLGFVTVRYYSASRQYLYEATNWCEFEPDATYGTADEPVVLPLVSK